MPDLASWLKTIESFHPSTIELGLARIQQVAQKMALTQFDCPVITVTGTNGKGSTIAALDAIYSAAGFRVGRYTSPHLLQFNERISIDQTPVSDTDLIQAFEAVEHARLDTALTFFEFTTLAALYLFQQANLDVVLLEVGLGGRLDAVNIIDADVAVVTNIDLDHCQWLGNTRASIAREKAGIFRNNKPVICSDRDPPEPLIAMAKQLDCPVTFVEQHFDFHQEGDSWRLTYEQGEYTSLPLTTILLENAATALMTVVCAQSQLPVSADQIRQGLAQIDLCGRYQKKTGKIEHLYDVAHNPQSARALAERLQADAISGKTHAVFSMLADKDIAATVAPLSPWVTQWHIAPLEDARTASVQSMAQALSSQALHTYPTITAAYESARAQACKGDRILIFGSFITVAKLLEIGV